MRALVLLVVLTVPALAQEAPDNLVSELQGGEGGQGPSRAFVADEGPFLSTIDPRSRKVTVARDSTVLTANADPGSPPLVRLGRGLEGDGSRSGPGRVQARFAFEGWVCVAETRAGVTRDLIPGWRYGRRVVDAGWQHVRAAPGRNNRVLASLPRGSTIELDPRPARPAGPRPATSTGGGWGAFDTAADRSTAPEVDDGLTTTQEADGIARTWAPIRVELIGHAPLADLEARAPAVH